MKKFLFGLMLIAIVAISTSFVSSPQPTDVYVGIHKMDQPLHLAKLDFSDNFEMTAFMPASFIDYSISAFVWIDNLGYIQKGSNTGKFITTPDFQFNEKEFRIQHLHLTSFIHNTGFSHNVYRKPRDCIRHAKA